MILELDHHSFPDCSRKTWVGVCLPCAFGRGAFAGACAAELEEELSSCGDALALGPGGAEAEAGSACLSSVEEDASEVSSFFTTAATVISLPLPMGEKGMSCPWHSGSPSGDCCSMPAGRVPST